MQNFLWNPSHKYYLHYPQSTGLIKLRDFSWFFMEVSLHCSRKIRKNLALERTPPPKIESPQQRFSFSEQIVKTKKLHQHRNVREKNVCTNSQPKKPIWAIWASVFSSFLVLKNCAVFGNSWDPSDTLSSRRSKKICVGFVGTGLFVIVPKQIM